MKLIFLGAPGAGKGTQAQKLMERIGIPQISTGDMLRQAIREGTATGLEAKKYIDAGELVPDDVVIDLVRERLALDDCKNGYILDGFPRTVKQAIALSQYVDIDVALNIDTDVDVIIKRLSGRRVCPSCGGTFHTDLLGGNNQCPVCGTLLIQRSDDTPDTVRNRLNVYQEKTAPLVSYYRDLGVLRTVLCNGTIDENFRAILDALKIEA